MATEEFCKFSEKGKRCVAGYNHTKDKHDMQPMGSITVQIIERQERFERIPDKVASRIAQTETDLTSGKLLTLEEIEKGKV
jgi:hypothetical protein